jgi:hypothetical protein
MTSRLSSDRSPALSELKELTPYVATLVLVAIVVFRVLPNWRAVRLDDNKVRLAELEVRSKEAEVRKEEAASIGRLTEVFKQASEASDELRILLRAVMNQHKVIEARVMTLELKGDNRRAT